MYTKLFKSRADPLTFNDERSVLSERATRIVNVYLAIAPFWAVTTTVAVLLPGRSPEVPRTSTVAVTSSAVAETTTEVVPAGASNMSPAFTVSVPIWMVPKFVLFDSRTTTTL